MTPPATTMQQNIGTDTARKLLFEMMRVRSVEERIAALYPEQEMRCPVHLSIGQEAVAVGVCQALRPQDYAYSTHRCHAHYLAKGGDLKAMLCELYGKADGCCKGKGGSMHLIDLSVGFRGAAPIVGSTIAVSVGSALSDKMRGDDRITVAFFGDGATEEGVFHESLNFAKLKNLPVIFLCENNLYSVYTPLGIRQPARPISDIAKAHGWTVLTGEGNDVEQVYRLTSEAIHSIERNNGPVFIELSTYRWREHCGPYYDDELGYRPDGELAEWQKLCPITAYEKKLIEIGRISIEEIRSQQQIIDAEIDSAVTFAKASPYPSPDALMTEVYA